MRDTREILRQKWLLGRSHRAIAESPESLGVSAGVVGLATRRGGDASVDWPAVEAMDDGLKYTAFCERCRGASNLRYAEVTWSQRGPDFIASHVRALEYLGGVPARWCPTS